MPLCRQAILIEPPLLIADAISQPAPPITPAATDFAAYLRHYAIDTPL